MSYAHVHAHVHTHVHTPVYAHVHIHVHTHVHTHGHGSVSLMATVMHQVLPVFRRVRTKAIPINTTRAKPNNALEIAITKEINDAQNELEQAKAAGKIDEIEAADEKLRQLNDNVTRQAWARADSDGNKSSVEDDKWVEIFSGHGSLEITTSSQVFVELTAAPEFTGTHEITKARTHESTKACTQVRPCAVCMRACTRTRTAHKHTRMRTLRHAHVPRVARTYALATPVHARAHTRTCARTHAHTGVVFVAPVIVK